MQTNRGRTYYYHPATKKSAWTAPDEVKKLVDSYDDEEPGGDEASDNTANDSGAPATANDDTGGVGSDGATDQHTAATDPGRDHEGDVKRARLTEPQAMPPPPPHYHQPQQQTSTTAPAAVPMLPPAPPPRPYGLGCGRFDSRPSCRPR